MAPVVIEMCIRLVGDLIRGFLIVIMLPKSSGLSETTKIFEVSEERNLPKERDRHCSLRNR